MHGNTKWKHMKVPYARAAAKATRNSLWSCRKHNCACRCEVLWTDKLRFSAFHKRSPESAVYPNASWLPAGTVKVIVCGHCNSKYPTEMSE